MFSVAGTFIFFLDHFRLYSTFCASHCQAQEVLREYYTSHVISLSIAVLNSKDQCNKTR